MKVRVGALYADSPFVESDIIEIDLDGEIVRITKVLRSVRVEADRPLLVVTYEDGERVDIHPRKKS